jgi:hypothetical protein
MIEGERENTGSKFDKLTNATYQKLLQSLANTHQMLIMLNFCSSK